jgi:hypothetical protein
VDSINWRRVWAAGNPSFSLYDTAEALEVRGLPSDRLQAEGWPTEPGRALLDYVPVPPIVGEMNGIELERLWTDGWCDAFFDLLIGLPATEHLAGGDTGMNVVMRAGDEFRLLSFDSRTYEDGPHTEVCIGIRRDGEMLVGAVYGADECEAVVAELLDLAPDVVRNARTSTGYCLRPW